MSRAVSEEFHGFFLENSPIKHALKKREIIHLRFDSAASPRS